MTPVWIQNLLIRLPGKPIHHIHGIILGGSLLILLATLFSPFFDIIITGFVIVVLFPRDNKLNRTEILDTRDWLIIRSFYIAVLLAWTLSAAQRLLSPERQWIDYVGLIFLIALPRLFRIYNAVVNGAKELPDWNTLTTVFRSRAEGDND